MRPTISDMSSSPAVDSRVLEQLHVALGHDTAVLEQIIDSYLGVIDTRFGALREAIDEPAKLGRAAHALASPSATLGVRSIAEPCLAIERAVEDGETKDGRIATLMATVEAAIDPVRHALRSWLAAATRAS
jgi:HPt (histidine-containing phosphotransfer) domain-containing protein